jgi:hypothetical protein
MRDESLVHLRTRSSMFDDVDHALVHDGLKPGALMHKVVYVWQCNSCMSKFDVAWLVVVSMFDA